MTDKDKCITDLEARGYRVSVDYGNDLPGYWVRVFVAGTLRFHARFGKDGREYGGRLDELLRGPVA